MGEITRPTVRPRRGKNTTGDRWFECSQRGCSICRETGHDSNKCLTTSKEDANLVTSDQEGLVADAENASLRRATMSRTPSSPFL